MRTDHGQVPDFPRINAEIVEDTQARVTVNGVAHLLSGEDISQTRAAVVSLIAETAQKLKRPVRARTVDSLGEWPLIVYEDGLVENDTTVEPPKQKKTRDPKTRSGNKGAGNKGAASKGSGNKASGKRRHFLGRLAKAPGAPDPVGAERVPETTDLVEPRRESEQVGEPGTEPVHAHPAAEELERERGSDRSSRTPKKEMAPQVQTSEANEASPNPAPTPPVPAQSREERRPVAPIGPAASGISPVEAMQAWETAIQEHNSGVDRPGGYATVGQGHVAPSPRGVETSVTGRFRRFLLGSTGEGRADQADFSTEIQVPIPDHRRITVLSLKGGVGKTTATVLLGSFLAAARESRVIAVDVNPDWGTLRDRVLRQNNRSLHDLSADADRITAYTELRDYVSVTDTRLHALVGASVPTADGQAAGESYRSVSGLLSRYYDLVVNDCGTGLHQPGMRDVLDLTDQVVVVLEASLDSVRSANSTFTWLAQNGYRDLAGRAIVVVSRVDRQASAGQEIQELERHLEASSGGMVRIPYDEHLAGGGVIHPDRLHESTRSACHRFAELCAVGLSKLR